MLLLLLLIGSFMCGILLRNFILWVRCCLVLVLISLKVFGFLLWIMIYFWWLNVGINFLDFVFVINIIFLGIRLCCCVCCLVLVYLYNFFWYFLYFFLGLFWFIFGIVGNFVVIFLLRNSLVGVMLVLVCGVDL